MGAQLTLSLNLLEDVFDNFPLDFLHFNFLEVVLEDRPQKIDRRHLSCLAFKKQHHDLLLS